MGVRVPPVRVFSRLLSSSTLLPKWTDFGFGSLFIRSTLFDTAIEYDEWSVLPSYSGLSSLIAILKKTVILSAKYPSSKVEHPSNKLRRLRRSRASRPPGCPLGTGTGTQSYVGPAG